MIERPNIKRASPEQHAVGTGIRRLPGTNVAIARNLKQLGEIFFHGHCRLGNRIPFAMFTHARNRFGNALGHRAEGKAHALLRKPLISGHLTGKPRQRACRVLAEKLRS